MVAENVQYELKKREAKERQKTRIKMSIDLQRQLATMSKPSTGESAVDEQFADILSRAAPPEKVTIPASSVKDVLAKCNVLGTVSAILTSRPSRPRNKTRAPAKPRKPRRCESRECKSST